MCKNCVSGLLDLIVGLTNTVTVASKNTICFKSGQKWSKNNHLASFTKCQFHQHFSRAFFAQFQLGAKNLYEKRAQKNVDEIDCKEKSPDTSNIISQVDNTFIKLFKNGLWICDTC